MKCIMNLLPHPHFCCNLCWHADKCFCFPVFDDHVFKKFPRDLYAFHQQHNAKKSRKIKGFPNVLWINFGLKFINEYFKNRDYSIHPQKCNYFVNKGVWTAQKIAIHDVVYFHSSNNFVSISPPHVGHFVLEQNSLQLFTPEHTHHSMFCFPSQLFRSTSRTLPWLVALQRVQLVKWCSLLSAPWSLASWLESSQCWDSSTSQ